MIKQVDGAAPSPPPPLQSAELLFNTQFFLSTVELRGSGHGESVRANDLLVGFQLLQFEIVLFDATTTLSSSDAAVDALDHDRVAGDRIELKLEHGKSCLFEADADKLALDLQRESDAPLALLVMRRDHGRARLVAFASVPLELHVGLPDARADSSSDASTNARADTDKVTRPSISSGMRFRVCEWASSSGSWELRDHANRVVGLAIGAVTLSCLGRTLAPHILNAIGLHVDKAEPVAQSDPLRDERARAREDASASQHKQDNAIVSQTSKSTVTDASQKANSTENELKDAIASSSAVLQPSSPPSPAAAAPSKSDVAVQCDDELFVPGAGGTHAITYSEPRADVHPAIRIESIKCRNVHRRQLEAPDATRPPSPPKSARGPVFASHNLPPPLFFHKPTKKKR